MRGSELSDFDGIRVSDDQTHHTLRGRPLYEKRFTRVMSFHHPGIAAVQDGSEAYHIRPDGSPLYARRFEEAFGFYEGLAAVKDETGCYHVDTLGNPAYEERFEWVGNFQKERAPAMNEGGSFFHILPSGEPAYTNTHCHVGDYYEGLAGVVDHTGAYHILTSGEAAYEQRYRQVGAYHKGYSVVLDDEGFCHIDKRGNPVYRARFLALDNFYNNHAWARSKGNQLVWIDTLGEIVRVLKDE